MILGLFDPPAGGEFRRIRMIANDATIDSFSTACRFLGSVLPRQNGTRFGSFLKNNEVLRSTVKATVVGRLLALRQD